MLHFPGKQGYDNSLGKLQHSENGITNCSSKMKRTNELSSLPFG